MESRTCLYVLSAHSTLFLFEDELSQDIEEHNAGSLPVIVLENNPCQTNPCLHGGSCLQEGDGYSCYCPQGYSGESCEIGFWIQCSQSQDEFSCQAQ
ncbi:hypothetical protein NQZ68_015011 [Dissostichus eleginoides]|nr:hypothetical protein NQZ68_015011 [Dissostichus eleginoides]